MNQNDCWQKHHFELLNIAYFQFSNLHEYHDVISPYSRIYLITKGEGKLVTGNKSIKLEEGFLYLVPSFIQCTYIFNKDLEHFYIHFRAFTEGGLTLNSLYNYKQKVAACDLTEVLLKRLLKINPGLELPHHDPKIYQNKPWMNKKPNWPNINEKMETEAILQILFSAFIAGISDINLAPNIKYNLHQILVYIQNNLQNEMKVKELADMAYLSNDHFTRIFKSVLGSPPNEYIVRKRIEKSQYLLVTTDLPINQIIEQAGFKSTSYFTRMFKKLVSVSPAAYRRKSS